MTNTQKPHTRRFYHLTKAGNIPAILETGLIPRTGPRAASVGEWEDHVYLCRTKERRKWKAVLGLDACLRITLPEGSPALTATTKRGPETCPEYLCPLPIPPECLSVVEDPPGPTPKDMRELAEDYLFCLSQAAVDSIRFCDRPKAPGEPWREQNLSASIRVILDVCSRIDFRYLDKTRARRILITEGNSGGYTMRDSHEDTGIPLMKMLGHYPDVPGHRERIQLQEFLEKTFPYLEGLSTGGYQNTYGTKNHDL